MKSNNWFKENDILKYNFKPIAVDNLYGYILPHAGTAHSGHILAHTLRFRPTKNFTRVLIIYLPAMEQPNVGKEYHEYYVPKSALRLYYPDNKYEYIGFNVLQDNINDLKDGFNLNDTLVVVSADFSHFLDLQTALKTETCGAKAIMHREVGHSCRKHVDDMRSFEVLYKLLDKTKMLQWIGRTRSSGEKGVGYLSFLIRDKPNPQKRRPDGLFVSAYDRDMRSRECLGEYNWSRETEKALIARVLQAARTTSRLTGGRHTDVPITHYTVEYLYRDTKNKFIRGVHAIKSVALYLPSVFLENVYDNGTWIQEGDREWPQEHQFDLTETLGQLEVKGGQQGRNYDLYTTEVAHYKLKIPLLQTMKGSGRTMKKKRKKKRKVRTNKRKSLKFNK